jgi:hypothetical protein
MPNSTAESLQVAQAQDTHQRSLGPAVDLDVVEHKDRQRRVEKIRDDVDGCLLSVNPSRLE